MKKVKWTVLIFLTLFIWGTLYPVSRYVVTDLHPLVLSFLRYFFALVAMTPIFLINRRKKQRIIGRDLIRLLLLGCFGVAFFSVLLFYGIKFTNSTTSSILANTQPVFVMLLAPFFTKERYTPLQLIGTFLGLAGMSLVVTGGKLGGFMIDSYFIPGCLFCIAAAAVIGLFYILLKQYADKYGSITVTYITFSMGMTILLVLALTAGDGFRQVRAIPGLEWLLIAYMGTIATAVVYLLHNRIMITIGVIRTVRMKFLIPVFGVLLSILFLDEHMELLSWIGLTVVVAAIILIQHQRTGAKA